MLEYSEETYGERIAGVYDQWYGEFDQQAVVALAELAHGGKALELGIGTGRIAIPLRQAGVDVQGLDVSPSMVARLHEKPGGEAIHVTMGNFAAVAVEGDFDLIYVVFNTIFSLLTQDEQARCFENVARHLKPGAVFVIEAFVPDMVRFIANQAMRVGWIKENEVEVDVSQVEMDTQIITSQHMLLTEHGTRFYPVKIRYIWPSEMDLMARLSGMRLRERWSDWNRSRFSSHSTRHISLYELLR